MSRTDRFCWVDRSDYWAWVNQKTAAIDEMNIFARQIQKEDSCVERMIFGLWNTVTSPAFIVVAPLAGCFNVKEESIVERMVGGLLVGVVCAVSRPVLEVLNPIPSHVG